MRPPLEPGVNSDAAIQCPPWPSLGKMRHFVDTDQRLDLFRKGSFVQRSPKPTERYPVGIDGAYGRMASNSAFLAAQGIRTPVEAMTDDFATLSRPWCLRRRGLPIQDFWTGVPSLRAPQEILKRNPSIGCII
jgi:hypothetical protein